MDYPIPTHLQKYLTPIGNANNEHQVTGRIHCSCGNEKFEIMEQDNKNNIKLICTECGHEILLFDIDAHGWNGFVCHESVVDRTLPFQKCGCSNCKADIFQVTVSVESQGKEDFVEECVAFDDTFSAEDWVNGFECIAISLSCAACQNGLKDWALFETM